MSEALHFRVDGPGITNLIRQIYLYEDKDKAWNMIGTMGEITVDQCIKVFMGDAEFQNPKENDGTLNYVTKIDKEWKEEDQKQANLTMAKSIFIQNTMEKDPLSKKANEELIKTFAAKLYSFDYNGHSYTYKDSARNQSMCPHCDLKAPDGSFWRIKDKGYIGYYDFKQGEVAVCFECPECFEKFYYHYNKNYVLREIKGDE